MQCIHTCTVLVPHLKEADCTEKHCRHQNTHKRTGPWIGRLKCRVPCTDLEQPSHQCIGHEAGCLRAWSPTHLDTSAFRVSTQFMVATVRGSLTPERNAIGHTHVRASSEHAWDPTASSSAIICRKTRTVHRHTTEKRNDRTERSRRFPQFQLDTIARRLWMSVRAVVVQHKERAEKCAYVERAFVHAERERVRWVSTHTQPSKVR
jgi:hypothetical protein